MKKKLCLVVFISFCSFLLVGYQHTAENLNTQTELSLINDIVKTKTEQLNLKFEFDEDQRQIKHEDAYLSLYLDLNEYQIFDDYLKIRYELTNNNNESYSGYAKYNFIPETDRKSGLLLSFDDYYKDNWEWALNIFSEYGLTCTWFPFGSETRIKDFYCLAMKKGHDVGFHTYSHIELVPGTEQSIVKEQAVDPLLGFYCDDISLKSFAFPGGKYEQWMIPYLQKYYKYLRMFHNKPIYYDIDVIKERRWFRSNSIDQKWLSADDFNITMDERLLITKICKYIYPCTTHYILNDKENEHLYDEDGEINDSFTIKESNLRHLLQRISDFKMNSLMFKDLC